MKKILQSKFTAMTLGGLSYLIVTAMLLKNGLVSAGVDHSEATHQGSEPVIRKGFWDENNREADQLIEELRNEKAELTKKEALLKDLAARLDAERAEINQITQRVHQLQVEFDSNVVRVKEEEASNLKRLAKLYATMTPEGASVILTELEDSTIAKIFMFMKEAESAPLLEALAKLGDFQAKRAAGISEQLRKSLAEKPKTKTQ